MTGSVEQPIFDLADRGRWWWLPREGVGNGLDDVGWAPILDIDAAAVADLLMTLRDAGVAAFASPTESVVQRLRGGGQRKVNYRLWVGTSRFGAAEETLVEVLQGSGGTFGDPVPVGS